MKCIRTGRKNYFADSSIVRVKKYNNFILSLMAFPYSNMCYFVFVCYSVPAAGSAESVKEAIESGLDSGMVLVNKEGSCYEYQWSIEWISKGGSQSLLQVRGAFVFVCLFVFVFI